MVYAWAAPPEEMPAKQHLIASLSNGYEKLIGDEQIVLTLSGL
jgi:hypothetical protein